MKKIINNRYIRLIICICLVLVMAVGSATAIIGVNDVKDDDHLKENRYADIGELFHDQAGEYFSNIEPSDKESVTLKIRTDRYNVTKAKIQYTVDEGQSWQESSMEFDKVDETGYYDLWVGTIPAQSKTCRYRFVVDNDGEKNQTYLYATGQSSYQTDIENMYSYIPSLKTPDWSKGAYWYFIHTDAFYNADTTNDLTDTHYYRSISWDDNVTSLRQRYGGDLKGITEKLSHISDLNVDAIYLNPIWISNQNVGYAPTHPYEISPYLGNDDDLIELINAIHKNKMYISLDAVLSNEPYEGIYVNGYHEFPLDGVTQNLLDPFKDMFIYYNWPDSYKTVWGNMTVNHASPLLQNIYYRSPSSVVQTYLKAPYNIDAWRFDAVSSYFSSETDNTNDIAEIMRNYIKTVNPNALMICEDFVEDYIYSGEWDSCWNNSYVNASRNWFAAASDQAGLFSALRKTVLIPRAYALSTINMYNDHDFTRISDNIEADIEKIKALQILTMTFVGSPCLYYGDEIGLANNKSQGVNAQARDSFDWDESNWNKEIYTLQKALGDLRKEYTALKDGAIKLGATDNVAMTAVLGRFDNKGSVITALNQSKYIKETEIDVKQFNVKDGVVLTDYLTGATYKVKDGKIKANIIPGGSIFVTGRASKYRNAFTLTKGSSNIVAKDRYTYSISDDSLMSRILKNNTVAEKTLYNGFETDIKITGKGKVSVNISDVDNSASYYNMIISSNNINLSAKSGKKVQKSFNYDTGSSLKLYRDVKDGKSEICIGICKENGSVEIIEESRMEILMSNTALLSFSGKSGSSELYIKINDGISTAISEDFNNESFGAMLNLNDVKINSKDSIAVIKSKKDSFVTAEIPSSDYTFKARFTSKSQYSCIADMESTDDYIYVKRENGNILFGRYYKGDIIEYSSVKDTYPEKDIVLQLQHIGRKYSAVYSYDSKTFYEAGHGIDVVYPYSKCAVLIPKEKSAEIDYVCFGNSVYDGVSTSYPITLYEINTDFNDVNSRYLRALTEIYDNIGKWEYCTGGIERTDSAGISQINIYSKVYKEFSAQATFDIKSSDGTAGFTFSRDSIDKTLGNAYVLEVCKDGTVRLKYQSETLMEAKAEPSENGIYIKVEKVSGKIFVYGGKDKEYLGCVTDETKSGFFTYYSNQTALGLYSWSVTDISGSWVDYLGEYTYDYLGENGNLFVNTQDQTFMGIDSAGFTDVAVSCNLDLKLPEDKEKQSAIGLIIGAQSGKQPDFCNGYSILYDSNFDIIVKRNGAEISKKYAGGNGKISFMAAYKNNRLYVYVNNSSEPLIDIEVKDYIGGVVGLTSANAKNSLIYGFGVEDISGISVENSKTYKDFAKASYIGEGFTKSYKTDFKNTSEIINDWCYSKSLWKFENGSLKGGSSSNKWNYIGLTSAKFDSFDLKLSMKYTDVNDKGFAVVSFGKKNYQTQYTEGGYSVVIDRNGSIRIYDGEKNKYINSVAIAYIPNYDASELSNISLRIVKSGKSISIYANESLVIQSELEENRTGYMGLHTSQCNCQFNSFEAVRIN